MTSICCWLFILRQVLTGSKPANTEILSRIRRRLSRGCHGPC